MNSLKKMSELADRFERKMSLAQTQTEDPKAVITDAFFGDPKSGKNNESFKQFLGTAESAFQQAIQNIKGSISIGASVDAPQKMANFLVAPSSPGLLAALQKDYIRFYGKAPQDMFRARLAEGSIRPPNFKGAALGIITF